MNDRSSSLSVPLPFDVFLYRIEPHLVVFEDFVVYALKFFRVKAVTEVIDVYLLQEVQLELDLVSWITFFDIETGNQFVAERIFGEEYLHGFDLFHDIFAFSFSQHLLVSKVEEELHLTRDLFSAFQVVFIERLHLFLQRTTVLIVILFSDDGFFDNEEILLEKLHFQGTYERVEKILRLVE